MTKFDRASLLLALCVTVIWMPILECHVPEVQVRPGACTSNIPCEACKDLAKQLYHQVEAERAEIFSEKIGEENKIIEYAKDAIIAIGEKNVCNLKQEPVEQDSKGQCGSECKTCQQVLHCFNTGVAEHLYKHNPDIDSFTKLICEDCTGGCKGDWKQRLKKGVAVAGQKLKRVFNEKKQQFSKSNKDEHEL